MVYLRNGSQPWSGGLSVSQLISKNYSKVIVIGWTIFSFFLCRIGKLPSVPVASSMASPESRNGVHNAIDLSHHINAKSRSRHPSPLKDIIKYMSLEGMISLAGGLPHPYLFPVDRASFTVANPNVFLNAASNDNLELEISNSDNIKLSDFIQYGSGAGNAQLRQWCLDFTRKVHRPLYKDLEVLLHPGNTNAWSKVVGLLCEEGDYILCESYTYPSAQSLWIPLGNFATPIAMDGQGIRDDELDQTLRSWEQVHPGVRRPHILYLVSVGSNPCGVTMGVERRRKIYEVCVKYDIIIVEDDPYFFIQYPQYEVGKSLVSNKIKPNDEFLAALSPSFVQLDYQGRVIRLESFSKTIGPGLRLGYFVANSLFTERLLRATEVETQDPSGLSQAFVLSLMQRWGVEGYLTWLQNLRNQYHIRRDWMINAFAQNFELSDASEFKSQGIQDDGLVASLRDESGRLVPIFSFVSPTGGMFIWAKFYLAQNPVFKELKANSEIQEDSEQTFAEKLWLQLAESLVLLTPGSYYHPWQGADKVTTKARDADPETTHFRFSFSMTTEQDMALGIARLAKIVKLSWKL